MARPQVSVAHFEPLIQGHGGRARIHENGLFEQLQQHLVDAAQVHDRAVIALHELFDRQGIRRVLVAQHAGEAGLVVE